MPWIVPKTDWDTVPKNPKAEDLNRIEGNAAFLKGDIETKKGLIVDALNTMGRTASLVDTHATLASKIKDISDDANAVVLDVLPGKTFYQGGVRRTGTMATKAAETFTPSTVNQTIAADLFLTGIQTIAGSASLVTGNIRAGVSIFGVAGKSSVVETASATILAADILSGKTGFANGALITGTIPSKTAQTFTPGTTNQTIAANQFLSGIQTISGSGNLLAANIRAGVNIFGVVGSAPELSAATISFHPNDVNVTAGSKTVGQILNTQTLSLPKAGWVLGGTLKFFDGATLVTTSPQHTWLFNNIPSTAFPHRVYVGAGSHTIKLRIDVSWGDSHTFNVDNNIATVL